MLLLILTAPTSLFAADTLIFAIDIIRHGDRTPFVYFPVLNHQWKEGLGQLTAEGMQQEYLMGVEFRKKYIEQEHLLPDNYEQGTMYVRSTDYDRTIMSAQSLLMGLYPPGKGPYPSESSLPALPHAFQPIPIFNAPAQYDEIIAQQVSTAERKKLMEQYVHSTIEWQNKEAELKDQYPRWSQLTGISIKSLEDIQILSDTLYVHKMHKAPMPEGLSASDIDTIIKSGSWAFMQQEKPQSVGKAYGSKLMNNIATYLKKGSQSNSKLKYVLLSAHDTTITSALSFLGAPVEKAPPYASNVNFSLYDTGSNYYTVQITYNGKPVTIPGCAGTVCELQQFIKLVREI